MNLPAIQLRYVLNNLGSCQRLLEHSQEAYKEATGVESHRLAMAKKKIDDAIHECADELQGAMNER